MSAGPLNNSASCTMIAACTTWVFATCTCAATESTCFGAPPCPCMHKHVIQIVGSPTCAHRHNFHLVDMPSIQGAAVDAVIARTWFRKMGTELLTPTAMCGVRADNVVAPPFGGRSCTATW